MMNGSNPVFPPEAYQAAVRAAAAAVPRERFVRPEDVPLARADHALPIGHGQTISQPSLVVQMTLLLDLAPGQRVLEVGTGSGYQTALLAALGFVEVYTIEIIPALASAARARLTALGYTAVHFREGDGYAGWAEAAPFNAIIVTAAPDHFPQPLIDQLADGGRLVTPVGPPGGPQTLWKVTRHGAAYSQVRVTGVAFVPLTRAPG